MILQDYVVSDIRKLENIKDNSTYGIMLEPRKLNFQKFKSLLESFKNGTNKINFKAHFRKQRNRD